VHQESNLLEKDALFVEEYEELTVETNEEQQSKLNIPSQYSKASNKSKNTNLKQLPYQLNKNTFRREPYRNHLPKWILQTQLQHK